MSGLKVLILGGTHEAAKLASELVASGHDVTTSLAGRTKEPRPVEGEVRVGGFGGVKAMAEYLTENRFDRLIDATHPFAEHISANAKEAAAIAEIPLEVRRRPPWQKEPGDNWIEVQSLDEAREKIPDGARVLLALGSQHIAGFQTREDVFFLVRMIDKPEKPLPLPNHALLLARPAQTARDEAAVLRTHAITHIVCRNSGGPGAYAKIEAARSLNLPVIIVQRS